MHYVSAIPKNLELYIPIISYTFEGNTNNIKLMNRLVFLGTGNAFATKLYNACFAIQQGEEYFLVDGGGGNGIISQCEKANIPITSIRNMFVTHNHSDHVLGAIWVIRFIGLYMHDGIYKGNFTVYGHQEVIDFIRYACMQTLPLKFTDKIDKRIFFQAVENGEEVSIQGCDFTFFDIYSVKLKQFGFKTVLPNRQIVSCLGDEPYNAKTAQYVRKSDWLICEAFCLESDAEKYNPREKYHSTVIDASTNAQELGVSHLIFYHTEEDTIATRKQTYMQEAAHGL